MLKKTKKAAAIMIAVLLLASVFPSAESFAFYDQQLVKTLEGGHSQYHTVSDFQNAYSAYPDIQIGGAPLDGTNGLPDICVPGLGEEENYVPQGMTYCEKLNLILVGCYNYGYTKPSVIYALDFETGEFVAQFNLFKSEETMLAVHLGGLACSEQNLYITTTGAKLCRVPISELEVEKGTVKDVVVSSTKSFSPSLYNAAAAYLSYSENRLWMGNYFDRANEAAKRANENHESLLLGFELSGDTPDREWKNLKKKVASPDTVIPLDMYDFSRVQGATVSDGTVFISCSGGRVNDSTLAFADLASEADIPVTINGKSFLGTRIFNIDSYSIIPMSEGIFFKEGYVYVDFETASYRYYGTGNTRSKNASDVVWRYPVFELHRHLTEKDPGSPNSYIPMLTSYYKRYVGFLNELIRILRSVGHSR